MFSAGIWPVVQRELRVTARRPLSHWLRVAAGFGAACIFCSSAWNFPESVVGPLLFHDLHRLIMALIFLVVPALTADSVSRERREETLGLLFLTPLRAWQIVIGKVLAQTLKALTLWLSVVPVLTIPFLMGGVGWPEVFNCLCQELCAGMLALAAGMVATSIAQRRDAAFVLAYVFAALLCFVPTQYPWWLARHTGGVIVRTRYFPPGTSRFAAPVIVSGFNQAGLPYYPALNRPLRFGAIVAITTAGAGTAKIAPSYLLESFLVASLILWAAIRFAGYCVNRRWKDRLPSQRQENWVKRYCSPIFKRSFARKMRKALEWNPVYWLQQYSWKARTTTWAMCLVFVALGCCVTNGANSSMLAQWELRLLVVLAAVYTYAGVNGFYQEKKNGALELLLVTPISVDEIIFGRVLGLWKRFLPTVLLMALWCLMEEETVWWHDNLYSGSIDLGGHVNLYWSDVECTLLAAYFTLPIFATFCALRLRNIVVATACTWLLILAGPIFGVSLLAFLTLPAGASPSLVYSGIALGNLVFVWFTFVALRDNLRQSISWASKA